MNKFKKIAAILMAVAMMSITAVGASAADTNDDVPEISASQQEGDKTTTKADSQVDNSTTKSEDGTTTKKNDESTTKKGDDASTKKDESSTKKDESSTKADDSSTSKKDDEKPSFERPADDKSTKKDESKKNDDKPELPDTGSAMTGIAAFAALGAATAGVLIAKKKEH